MKRTLLPLALASVLAACGSAADTGAPEPAAPVQQTEATLAEQPKIDVAVTTEHLDPLSTVGGAPFGAPTTDEAPVSGDELKYLNLGVARAVMEYRMVGESLKWGLAGAMGNGVDAWIKLETDRCISERGETFAELSEITWVQSQAMCIGLAYGYWALVNGTVGTEGSPRQCLEKGYCGFMFRQYDSSADPAFTLASAI
jgi:hypothetical protein